MFRRLMLIAVAAPCLGGTALAPVPVAAGNDHHNQYWPVWGPHFVNGVPVSYGYGLCYQRALLQTPWGPRLRLVNRCW